MPLFQDVVRMAVLKTTGVFTLFQTGLVSSVTDHGVNKTDFKSKLRGVSAQMNNRLVQNRFLNCSHKRCNNPLRDAINHILCACVSPLWCKTSFVSRVCLSATAISIS